MMGSFGFKPVEEGAEQAEAALDPALTFAPRPLQRPEIPLAHMDAVAESVGFVSREKGSPVRRRRRTVPRPPQRMLPIRLVEGEYLRFVAIADRLGMTYSETVSWLLDRADGMAEAP